MALRRLCLECQHRHIVSGRDLCQWCAETLDDQLAGLLEAAAPED